MNKLMNATPKNGGLTSNDKNMLQNFPTWSSWIDDIFSSDKPSVLTSNFNTRITLLIVNISETTDAYLVAMAVPGMK